MNQTILVLGPSRNGTTITERIIRSHPAVSSDQYIPFARWEFAAITEVAGNLKHTPVIDGLVKAMQRDREWRHFCVKVALPWSLIALGWRQFVSRIKPAKIVFIARGGYDAYQSVCKMPHVKAIDQTPCWETYREWHQSLARGFVAYNDEHPGTSVCLTYERLVMDTEQALEPMWQMLDCEPIANAACMIRRPKHWSSLDAPEGGWKK